ncbi:4175_t:CDS:2 [Funneliformis mosseae]|uniref:4175_t:CDS:1 n=1 Tax=Funneliformis mosseae TaxID=27381 RepID=A0A9N9FFZ2_FUNMO|nr:4175_t:CDS:2 [Funneliformis mosseae]
MNKFYKQANDAFFEDDYDEALKLYNEAIELDATNAEYFLKRSATYQKLKKNKESLDDAEKVFNLVEGKEEEKSVKAKALLRKGIALFELKNYQGAKDSFESSKELNPNEKLLATWLRKVETELKKSIGTQPAQTAPSGAANFLSQSRKETVEVYMADRSVSVTVKLPTGSDYSLELDPLAHEINPKESKYEVLSTKIEVKLKKASIGVKWGVLEGEETLVGSISGGDGKLTYPSSAKHAKNWDALEKEISKEQDKPEGEAALNALFQQLYKDADDDTRRAMLKSYTESSGTCLSTNWNEVSKGTVETKPPEGMVAKKKMFNT